MKRTNRGPVLHCWTLPSLTLDAIIAAHILCLFREARSTRLNSIARP
jgi:hypothetical protein